MNATNPWSNDLREQTLECIATSMVSPLDGKLHFKHWDKRYASMALNDILNDRMVLVDKSTGQSISYDSAEALVEGGWVID